MSEMSDADFASYVDRIMACRDAEDAAKADTKLVYAAAADAGIDKTALGLFVRIERMDQTQVNKANRKDELTEEYRARYRRGKASHVRVREAAVLVTAPNTSVPAGFDPETGEEVTTEINETQSAPAARDLTVPPSPGQVATYSQADVDADLEEQEKAIPATIQPDGPADQSVGGAEPQADAAGEAEEPSKAEASSAPIYAEPGEVVMESCPPVGIVAHPYAACWPVNTVDVASGIEKPIVKIGHLILDGRGRYFAARAAHIEYPVVQYDGDDDLADSIAWNVAARPNMDPRALRIVAQKLAKLAPDRADEILERMGLAQISEAAE